MKAIFKPEDASKLIVRDADINEASLIINFLDKIKKGAPLEAQATFNGNYETNGILFSLGEIPDTPEETPTYLKIEADVTNSQMDLPVFKIKLSPAYNADMYMSYKVDITVWDEFKNVLESIGLANPSITPDGVIVADNTTSVIISASIVIPRGLLQYINTVDSTTENFNDTLVVKLGEENDLTFGG